MVEVNNGISFRERGERSGAEAPGLGMTRRVDAGRKNPARRSIEEKKKQGAEKHRATRSNAPAPKMNTPVEAVSNPYRRLGCLAPT
ncbi:MAG TPA: hypothetical protein PKC22_13850 [Rhodocyclaceae bacterium]|nr:hypothetical protein [Rhodocyclaceae bacterium]